LEAAKVTGVLLLQCRFNLRHTQPLGLGGFLSCRTLKIMNYKKLIILSSMALGMFAVSAAIAQTQMHRTSMRGAPTMARPGGRVFAGGGRFNGFDHRRRFNDHDFDHRFRNRFVFIDSFGFPFFYPYPYPYYGYYPYDYGDPYNYDYSGYQGPTDNGSLVVQVQSGLARTGYYHGEIDGVMGPRTRAAIRAYERTHNLPVDGVITKELLGTMRLRY
jgi:hypothetical protein